MRTIVRWPGGPWSRLLERLGTRAGALAVAGSCYLGLRLLDLVFFSAVIGRHRHYLTHATSLGGALGAWDGGWYRRIAQDGYSWHLVKLPSGGLAQSSLAFYPLYPLSMRAAHWLTGLPYLWVGSAINLVAGLAAALGLVLLLWPLLGPSGALAGSVLWSALPTAPVLDMGYSEGLFCAEVVAFFLLLHHRRYPWLVLVLLMLGLTRATTPPLVAVLLVHAVVRWRAARPGARRQELGWPVALLGIGVLSSLLWPGIVAVGTGRWNAYLQVQQAWRVSPDHIVTPWLHALLRIGNQVAQPTVADVLVMTVLACAALSLWALRRPLSPELKVYPLAFLAFVLVAMPPYWSVLRFLLPVVTLPAALALGLRSTGARIGLLALMIPLQYWWIGLVLTSTQQFHVSA